MIDTIRRRTRPAFPTILCLGLVALACAGCNFVQWVATCECHVGLVFTCKSPVVFEG